MTADDVLQFWFSAENEPFWFEKSADFDRRCQAVLEAPAEAAVAGRLDDWQAEARRALALVILLDQVPRNLYRGSARAFAGDAAARAAARVALARGFDLGMSDEERLFLYLPFEHSEDLADQHLSCALFSTLADPEYLKFAVAHRVLIERYGRFPHRNAALGRSSTPEEESYLAQPGAGF